jgi:hypothetical protein
MTLALGKVRKTSTKLMPFWQLNRALLVIGHVDRGLFSRSSLLFRIRTWIWPASASESSAWRIFDLKPVSSAFRFG